MRKILLPVLLLIISLSLTNKANAQYRTGIGAQFGNWMGLTVKQYMNTNADQSMELLVITDNVLWRATGIYAWNKSVRLPGMKVSGLNWHYGVGIHAGYYNNGDLFDKDGKKMSNIDYGVDCQLGIELLMGEIPFSIGLDLNPFYSIPAGGREYTGTPLNGALVLRYLIK